jgi:mRNA interferase HigB
MQAVLGFLLFQSDRRRSNGPIEQMGKNPLAPVLGTCYAFGVRVIAKRTLRRFWESDPQYTDAKGPLESWHQEAIAADWATPQEIKAHFGHASILKGNRVVFNIAGNKYRLVVKINYAYRVVYIRFIGTHRDYDEIDAESV